MERNLTLIAMFTALIAVLGLIPPITLISGIPITAQSLGVMLCGSVLGAKRGGLAVLLFIGLVAIGLPLLPGGRGGIAVFFGATGGFLFGFPVAAYVTGLVTERWSGRLDVGAAIAAIIGGVIVLYAFGIIWFKFYAGVTFGGATATMGAYIPGDIIKAVLTGLITAALYKARPQAVLSRN